MPKLKNKFVSVFILSVMIVVLSGCADDLPPEIEYGEFPFRFVYEMNGETYIIEDTVVCTYSGMDGSGGIRKIRCWSSDLKESEKLIDPEDGWYIGSESIIKLSSNKNEYSKLSPNRKNIRSCIYLYCGDPGYYMGEQKGSAARIEYYEKFETPQGESGAYTVLTEKQLEEFFGVKIIEFTFSDPIENTFK